MYFRTSRLSVDMAFILESEGIAFDIGNDNLPYAIFETNSYSWEYRELLDAPGISHWGGYENAVCLQETIGL